MSDEYQDGCMIASQVIAALKLAIERYGDLPVTRVDSEWSDVPIRFISFAQKDTNSELPDRIQLAADPPEDGEVVITRAKRMDE